MLTYNVFLRAAGGSAGNDSRGGKLQVFESFGNDLTIPVRTRSRLKHILLENTYGENFMEHKPFLIEDVEFHHQGTYAENDSSKYNSVKPSASVGPGSAKQMKIGLKILGRTTHY